MPHPCAVFKWKRLKNIVNKITGKDITISLWTNMNNSINAFTDNTGNIVLNGEKLKNTDDIFKGIAHEVTHINHPELKNEKTKEFKRKWSEYEKTIKKLYYKETI